MVEWFGIGICAVAVAAALVAVGEGASIRWLGAACSFCFVVASVTGLGN